MIKYLNDECEANKSDKPLRIRGTQARHLESRLKYLLKQKKSKNEQSKVN